MRVREFKQMLVDEFMGLVEDPRIDRTRKHSLEIIVVISLMAVICGADSFVAIEKFAVSKRDWLETFLDMENGFPPHDTVGRVFAALSSKSLGAAFRNWTQCLCSTNDKLLAIHGKAFRRSYRKAGRRAENLNDFAVGVIGQLEMGVYAAYRQACALATIAR